jgi:hypothetical protein
MTLRGRRGAPLNAITFATAYSGNIQKSLNLDEGVGTSSKGINPQERREGHVRSSLAERNLRLRSEAERWSAITSEKRLYRK